MSANTAALTIRLPAELHDALRTRATQEGRSVAEVIRAAARAYLATPCTVPALTGPRGGWTSHGHAMPGVSPDPAMRPALIARCGGPRICPQCALEAAA